MTACSVPSVSVRIVKLPGFVTHLAAHCYCVVPHVIMRLALVLRSVIIAVPGSLALSLLRQIRRQHPSITVEGEKIVAQ